VDLGSAMLVADLSDDGLKQAEYCVVSALPFR
jgi:hypothetical protein